MSLCALTGNCDVAIHGGRASSAPAAPSTRGSTTLSAPTCWARATARRGRRARCRRGRRRGRRRARASARARRGARYCADFPYATLRDSVRLHHLLVAHLGVRRLHAVVGGSAGGMQALEWALMYPALVERVVAIGCGATQSAWQVAISEAQRQAIYRDALGAGLLRRRRSSVRGARRRAVGGDDLVPLARGVRRQVWAAAAARRARAHQVLRQPGRARRAAAAAAAALARRRRPRRAEARELLVEGYLEHQGAKFVDRFDANAYVALTRMLDSHDVGRGRGGVEAALARCASPRW